MSYLKYANICADMMRGVMKEPFKSKQVPRGSIYFRASKVVDGKQTVPGAPRPLHTRLPWLWEAARTVAGAEHSFCSVQQHKARLCSCSHSAVCSPGLAPKRTWQHSC
jgi:hypothetical protein